MSVGRSPLFDFMFSVVPALVTIGFIAVFAIIIFNIIKGIKTWSNNNAQPVLSVYAKVVSKRTNVSSSMGTGHNNTIHHHTHTSYYVTFEVESGDRMEFKVAGTQYGMLVEGDAGKLTFQGTRYLGFAREKSNAG